MLLMETVEVYIWNLYIYVYVYNLIVHTSTLLYEDPKVPVYLLSDKEPQWK